MKIAIITRPDNKSPKNLALTLASTLDSKGVVTEIFYDIGFLTRMIPITEPHRWKTKLHYRIRQKLRFLFKDMAILKRLKTFDALILCECIPNGMWRNLYPIQRLKERIHKPIGLYEVFFLDAAPHFIDKLKKEDSNFTNPFDFELAVSDISYTKIKKKHNQFEVGLNLKGQGLKVVAKKELIALLDFEWEGETKYILEQKKILETLGITYIELKGSYTFAEIRALYEKCSLFFLQHFESFGLPIAECLSYGAQIFTANSGWPMAFRRNDDPQIYGEGDLADCFTVYDSEADLKHKLRIFSSNYNKCETPLEVFKSFETNYARFYNGDVSEIDKMLNFIRSHG